jgi:HSP20 family protein
MLARYNGFGFSDLPFGGLGDVSRQMDRLLSDFERGWLLRSPWPTATGPSLNSALRFQLEEQEGAWVLSADLPGVADEDLDIQIEDGTLTITGERKVNVPEGYQAVAQERASQKFTRSFQLASAIDTSAAQASLKNGVLEVRLPIAEAARPRKIAVASK